jgi:hypothetical protein
MQPLFWAASPTRKDWTGAGHLDGILQAMALTAREVINGRCGASSRSSGETGDNGLRWLQKWLQSVQFDFQKPI